LEKGGRVEPYVQKFYFHHLLGEKKRNKSFDLHDIRGRGGYFSAIDSPGRPSEATSRNEIMVWGRVNYYRQIKPEEKGAFQNHSMLQERNLLPSQLKKGVQGKEEARCKKKKGKKVQG